MKILAGLRESKSVDNPLPRLLEAERQQILKEKQRVIDEQKTVVTHLDLFQEKMEKYQEMIKTVNRLFIDKNKKEFVSGLYESKYSRLQRFADIVVNDSLSTIMTYLEDNYYSIKEDLDKIIRLNESIDENNAKTFFASQTLTSHDPNHSINICLFKYRTLEEKVSSEIPYGSEIMLISENLTLVRHSGKKYYTRLTENQIATLEKKGFLI